MYYDKDGKETTQLTRKYLSAASNLEKETEDTKEESMKKRIILITLNTTYITWNFHPHDFPSTIKLKIANECQRQHNYKSCSMHTWSKN